MNPLVDVKGPVVAPAVTVAATTFWLPSILACNTVLLWALQGVDAIPGWLKVAATVFLRF